MDVSLKHKTKEGRAMLVLTRKLGQNILIGEDVTIKIIKIESNKVQLGICAPNDVVVYRQELVDKIKRFNRNASRTDHTRLKNVAKVFKQIMKF